MPPRKPATRAPAPKKSIWDLSSEEAGMSRGETPGMVAQDMFLPEVEIVEKPATFSDIEGIKREALKFGEGYLGFLLWMDSKFVEQGQPALSAWWRQELALYFASEKTWCLARVGRGGGKSTSLVRVAVLYVLFGCLFTERKVPPGQRWIWPFVSASTMDAGRRLREIQALLLALGLETRTKVQHGAQTIEMIDTVGNEVMFLSIAATIAGVSGPSALGATVDEEAKLRDRAANVNPSTEILASIAQMFRARPGVHAIRCSSAWREAGSHYASIQDGDTDVTYVARLGEAFLGETLTGLHDVATWEASRGNEDAARKIRLYAATVTADSPNIPTWVANPTISAMASRSVVESTPVAKDEGNTPRWQIWLRENASVSMPIGAGVGGGDFTGLADANRKLAAGQPREGLQRFDGLSHLDPRSRGFVGGYGGGENSF